MAQGYPPPQYPQSGYGQQPQPYGQNPYPPHGRPAPQPFQYQPRPMYTPDEVPAPPETSNWRRFPAILIDCLVAVGPAFAVADKAGNPGRNGAPASVPWIVALVATGLVLSFVNQVLLARRTGFSVGKGVMALRVIRPKHVMRPDTWRLTRRWLLGFVFLLFTWLAEEFEGAGDIVGVRIVRWKHLREYRQAVARLS
ncbi:RDD family protein [Kitasatospora sp. NPDC101155]|uniref:RDD family protein n=1 Tax=Kitasatospora sp. NPDC101155 TaxID=3364097 RepID=UPI0038298579